MRFHPWIILAGCVACVGDSNTSDGGLDATTDVGVDAGVDAPIDTGTEAEAEAGPVTVYNDMTNASNWLVYDVTKADSTLGSNLGAAVAGHYLYVAPEITGGRLARYDINGTGFDQAASWTPFNMIQYNAGAYGYGGTLYDGTRYLYLNPYKNTTYDGLFTRVDTQGTLTDTSAYKFYDLTAVDANAVGFGNGNAFDGRFMYFAPYFKAVALRYDTQSPMDQTSSYKKIDLTSVTGANGGLNSGATDGKFVYWATYGVGTGAGTLIVRYDSSLPFDQIASFTSLDVKTAGISTVAAGFSGSCFDGKFIYFASATTSVVVRYDTTKTFSQATSWNAYDTVSVDAKSHGTAAMSFDGKWVYFAPVGGAQNVVLRFDSTGSLGSVSSWQSFDVTTLGGAAGATAFAGMSFDGRYMYFADYPKVAARFDAKSPPSVPARPLGSFY